VIVECLIALATNLPLPRWTEGVGLPLPRDFCWAGVFLFIVCHINNVTPLTLKHKSFLQNFFGYTVETLFHNRLRWASALWAVSDSHVIPFAKAAHFSLDHAFAAFGLSLFRPVFVDAFCCRVTQVESRPNSRSHEACRAPGMLVHVSEHVVQFRENLLCCGCCSWHRFSSNGVIGRQCTRIGP
jgi:hypothetical protein